MNEQEQMQQVQQIAEEVYKSLLQDPEATIAQLDQMNLQDGSGSQLLAVVITNHEDVLPIVEKFKEAPVVQESILLLQEGAQLPLATPAMRNGAKLNYLKSLKGNCPEGYETVYMKAGGRVCPVCQKKKAAQSKAKKAEEGTKMSGVSKTMSNIKSDLAKCGKKIVKNQEPALPIMPLDTIHATLYKLTNAPQLRTASRLSLIGPNVSRIMQSVVKPHAVPTGITSVLATSRDAANRTGYTYYGTQESVLNPSAPYDMRFYYNEDDLNRAWKKNESNIEKGLSRANDIPSHMTN